MALYFGRQRICPIIRTGDIINQDMTITENGTYSATSGYTGLGTITVNVSSISPTIFRDWSISNNESEGE